MLGNKKQSIVTIEMYSVSETLPYIKAIEILLVFFFTKA